MDRLSGSASASSGKRQRTPPVQYLREVRGELRRVHWPTRAEVTAYSIVVLVTVAIITLYVFGLDALFGRLVLWIFG